MGIHGIFKEIGQGERISLAKLSSDHLVTHKRPLRIAVDISIWLFQIQAGKGGSNPALRTFYYRLLRLLSLNIHPLFVFDGPNKPLFKRNKKVGGPGVRVASVPEFLAKQLLKQFGFPWHVAPGEAEAECALLQTEGIVDAVLSEDVDTLMFGSGVTLRNWSAEGTSKTPTHVNIYRAHDTKEKSGLDRQGMILVALMSGGDYITEGIPGCGPKFACDAARAGFGKDLCALGKRDTNGLQAWREKLQHQICTNEDKIFSRRNTKLVIPEDFPNHEVLGYYTQPCVSTPDKLARLREALKWDQDIDFPALRNFASDAFDWRCLGGAKKFIRNLAPAMLVRELRLRGAESLSMCQQARQELEEHYVKAIHGKRNHKTTDGELEYRISFVPLNLVPIDLAAEEADDDFIPAGGGEEQSDVESEFAELPSSTADEEVPSSPKKRVFKPYHPDQPEKLWLLYSFLRAGCPLLVNEYQESLKDPREYLKGKRKARTVAAGSSTNIHAKKATRKKKTDDSQQGALLAHVTVVKSSQAVSEIDKPSQAHSEFSSTQEERAPLDAILTGANARTKRNKTQKDHTSVDDLGDRPVFRSTQLAPDLQKKIDETSETTDNDKTPTATRSLPPAREEKKLEAFNATQRARIVDSHKSPPRRKRRSPDAASPALSQRTIDTFFSPSPRKPAPQSSDIINLVSSSPAKPDLPRASTPTPIQSRTRYIREDAVVARQSAELSPGKLPDSVTKRRKKTPLKRHQTAPIEGEDDAAIALPKRSSRPSTPELAEPHIVDAMDLATPPTVRHWKSLPDGPELPNPISRLDGRLKPIQQESTTQDATLQNMPPPRPAVVAKKISSKATSSRPASSSSGGSSLRRSPRQQQQQAKKKRIQLRESLEGAWKETEAIDLSGDGSGWKQSGGRANLTGWRKSGIEVLDLTGA